jgi:hypothetical protein
MPPLHDAAISGDAAALRRLLDAGGDVNARDSVRQQREGRACSLNSEQRSDGSRRRSECSYFSHTRARSARSQYGRTPLHCAAAYGKLEVATLLLERGADKEAKDNVRPPRCRARRRSAALALRAHRMSRRRCTMLQFTASSRSPRCCWSAVRTRRPRPMCERRAAALAAAQPRSLCALAGWPDAAALCCCERQARGRHAAAGARRGQGGQEQCATAAPPRSLPLSRARSARSQAAWTPLHWAAASGKLEVATLLLERGADKEAKDNVRPPRRRARRRSAALAPLARRVGGRRWQWLRRTR